MHTWQLQQAKARLSELVRRATSEGPQGISVRGTPSAVVLSKEDYERLAAPCPPLAQFLRSSPLAGADLELERDRSPDRNIDL